MSPKRVKLRVILEADYVYKDGPEDHYGGADTVEGKVAVDREGLLEGDFYLTLDAFEFEPISMEIVSIEDVP